MKDQIKALLTEAHRRRHVFKHERLGSPPASPSALQAFETRFGPIPGDYRWYLEACGGGTVGAEWVDGIEKLASSHERFGRDAKVLWPELATVFVFGQDGSGCWMGIQAASGRIVRISEDGELDFIADSFQEFLVRGLLEGGQLPEAIQESNYVPGIGADDCEVRGRSHSWYNADGRHSGCYQCKTVKLGQLWKKS